VLATLACKPHLDHLVLAVRSSQAAGARCERARPTMAAEFRAALDQCKARALWERSLLLLHRARHGFGAREISMAFESAVVSCSRAKRWQHALQGLWQLHRTPGLGLFGGTCSAAISACAKSSRWEQSLLLLSDAKSKRMLLDTSCYNAAVSACVCIAAWSRALVLFRQMTMQLCSTVSSCELWTTAARPDTWSYNAVMSVCGEATQWRWVLWLLGHMATMLVSPDVVSHSVVIAMSNRMSMWEQALVTLHGMHSATLQPNIVSFSAAISSCLRGKRWDLALQTFEKLQASRGDINAIAFTGAFYACEAGRQRRRAVQLLNEMCARSVEPDVVSHFAAIQACGGDGGGAGCDGAMWMWRPAEGTFRAGTYSPVIRRLRRLQASSLLGAPGIGTSGTAAGLATGDSTLVGQAAPDLGAFTRDAEQDLCSWAGCTSDPSLYWFSGLRWSRLDFIMANLVT